MTLEGGEVKEKKQKTLYIRVSGFNKIYENKLFYF